MKNKMKNIFVLMFIVIVFLVNNVYANDSEKSAHCIYSSLDTSETSGKYDTFMVDFRAPKAPENTYWCMIQSELNLDNFKNSQECQEFIDGRMLLFWFSAYY